jgi:hypothetical protein
VSDDGQLVLDLRADTHSGDLADLDLEALVALWVNGDSLRPVAATALAGHHSTGSVTFDPNGAPQGFAITIASVRGMEGLRFEWP